MAASERKASTGGFDIRRVIGRTFTAVKGHGLAFVLMAIPLFAAPRILMRLSGAYEAPVGWRDWLQEGVGTLSMSILAAFYHAWVARVVVDDRRAGWNADYGQILHVLSRAGPLVVTTVVSRIGVMIGLVLFVVPGVMLSLSWSVAILLVAVERKGPREALARSAALTSGHRGKIFILTLFLLVPSSIVNFVAKAATGGSAMKLAMRSPLAIFVVEPIWAIVVAVIFAAGLASIYVELVTIKEGGEPSALAEVFS